MFTENDLEKLVEREFSPDQIETVLSYLRSINSEANPGKSRIQKAILKLSRGNLEEIPNYLETANVDWRDVAAWAEYPLQMMDSDSRLKQYFPYVSDTYERLDRQQYENWEKRDASSVEILRVLRIGIDTTMRGKGISLRQAIEESNYNEIRKKIRVNDIQEIAIGRPEFFEAWFMYSEDKRTSGGFALPRMTKPQVENKLSLVIDCIQTSEELGKYVLKELDYWSGIRG